MLCLGKFLYFDFSCVNRFSCINILVHFGLKIKLFRYYYYYYKHFKIPTHNTNSLLKKLHWLPIKQRIDYKLCLLTYKTLTNQQPTIFTIVFHFRHILFLQDLLIHLFFPFHMSDHHLAKELSLSLVHDSGIHFLLTPETRLLYQYSVPCRLKTHLFKIAFPP